MFRPNFHYQDDAIKLESQIEGMINGIIDSDNESTFSDDDDLYQYHQTHFASMFSYPNAIYPPVKKVDPSIEELINEISEQLTQIEKIDFTIYAKLKGKFLNVIKTHKGSRMFQNYLKTTQSAIIHLIYAEIRNNIIDIMCDSYGNYFCKKFFISLSKKDRMDYINTIKPYFINLSFDTVATFPIQAIIEQITSNYEKRLIINIVKQCLSSFCFNASGARVIEKIIQCFEEEYTQCIFEYAILNFASLSKDASGACVVKKMISYKKDKTPYINTLKRLVIDNIKILINHQNGYLVIQSAIQNWNEYNIKEILNMIKNNYAVLSMGKYSSNVIEKCVEKSERVLSIYINEICTEHIGEIMRSSYGNYVIQKALKVSKGTNERILAQSINKNIYQLNDRKLISKWKNIVVSHLK